MPEISTPQRSSRVPASQSDRLTPSQWCHTDSRPSGPSAHWPVLANVALASLNPMRVLNAAPRASAHAETDLPGLAAEPESAADRPFREPLPLDRRPLRSASLGVFFLLRAGPGARAVTKCSMMVTKPTPAIARSTGTIDETNRYCLRTTIEWTTTKAAGTDTKPLARRQLAAAPTAMIRIHAPVEVQAVST